MKCLVRQNQDLKIILSLIRNQCRSLKARVMWFQRGESVIAYVLLGFVSFVISQFCCSRDYKGYCYKNQDEY